MLQFYFLSIITTLLGGISLVSGSLGENLTSLASLWDILGRRGVKVTLGLSSLTVGFVKLIVRSPNDTVPVAGDLLPALVGMALGLALLLDSFKPDVSSSDSVVEKAGKLALLYRIPIGAAGILAALLHFFFSGAVIL